MNESRNAHDNVPLEVPKLPEELVYLVMSFWHVPTIGSEESCLPSLAKAMHYRD
jgi:hypothetical protein